MKTKYISQMRKKNGQYTKKEKEYQEMFRNIQMFFGVLFLLGYAFILVKPIEQYNPLVSIETTYAQVNSALNSNSKDQAEDNLDTRIEDCWKKGWTPSVLEQGFVCIAPAVEVSTK